MAKTWTIGSGPGCDLPAPAPASARHCRLTIGLGGALLEDLGSTQGTYVNGVRVVGTVLVTRADAITLGPSVPMPWPPEPAPFGPEVLRIGRDPENDFVVNLPTVSSRHARVTWSGKPGEAEIEDLGSANGTAIGSPDRKITRSSLTALDTVYLGTSPVSGASLLAKVAPTFDRILMPEATETVIGRAPECRRVLDLPTVSGRHARISNSGGRTTIEDLGSANGTFVNGRRIEGPTPLEPGDIVALGLHQMRFAPGSARPTSRVARTVAVSMPEALLPTPDLDGTGLRDPAPGPLTAVRLVGLLAEAPVLALLIVGALGGRASSDPAGGGVGAVPAVLFALALAATWFGLSNAVIVPVLGGSSTPPKGTAIRNLPEGLALLAFTCVAQCVVLWGIVAAIGGLRGPWLPSVGLLILASMVGAAMGLLIDAASPRREAAWVALAALLLMLWMFGAGPGAPGRAVPGGALLSSMAPSRWAFEGLLLLESDGAVPPAPPRGGTGPVGDLAERYFPAQTDRMGPTADATALVAMLAGLSASAAFVGRSRGSGPWPLPGH